MNRLKDSDAEPLFGRQLAVFVAVFVLIFGPCLPVSPCMTFGVQSAWATDIEINGTNSPYSTRINAIENVNVTNNGVLNVTGENLSVSTGGMHGGAVNITGNFTVEGNGTVNLTTNTVKNNGGGIYANGTGTNTFTNNSAVASSSGGLYMPKTSPFPTAPTPLPGITPARTAEPFQLTITSLLPATTRSRTIQPTQLHRVEPFSQTKAST